MKYLQDTGVSSRGPSGFAPTDGFILAKDGDGRSTLYSSGFDHGSMFVDERFLTWFRKARKGGDSSRIRTLNAGVSGNHSLNTSLNLIAKVLKHRPKVVVMMETINDLGTLMNTGSYWNATGSRSLVQDPGEENAMTSLRAIVKAIKNLIAPNTWIIFKYAILARFPDRNTDEFKEFRDQPRSRFQLDAASAEFRSALNANVALLRAWGIKPVLMTQFNRFEVSDQFLRSRYELNPGLRFQWEEVVAFYRRFNEVVREVAATNKIMLIDLDKAVPKTREFMYDSVHLNEAGSRLVAGIVAGNCQWESPAIR
jgi:lysophospholipase L1-like esterase